MSTRLRTVCLFVLFAVAALSALPKIDLPETAFDESDAPTVQAVITEAASSKCISPRAASAPILFERTCNAPVRIGSPEYTTRLSDLPQLPRPLSALRC
jgi:hypothetical protein